MKSPFAEAYHQFTNNITALRGFFQRVHPLVDPSENPLSLTRLESVSRRVGKSTVAGFIKNFVDGLEGLLAKKDQPKGSEESFTFQVKVPEGTDPEAAAELEVSLFELLRQWSHEVQHPKLLNSSVLVSLVGFHEVLLSNLLHIHYRLHPGAITSADKADNEVKQERQFNLAEVLSYKTLEEFTEYAVDDKVDGFLRQSAQTWAKFFERLLKISANEFIDDNSTWIEYFQRRHIIIHNGGRVSRLYLKNVDPLWIQKSGEDMTLGSQVIVSREYLSRALNDFEASGAELCQECWLKFAADELEVREKALLDHQYERVKEGSWVVVEKLGRWAVRRGKLSSAGSLTATMNCWLAIKRQNRWAEIENEVNSLDISALHPQFLLAVFALRDDVEKFFKLLPTALSSGVSKSSLAGWPILEEMRRRPEFEPYIEGTTENALAGNGQHQNAEEACDK